MTNPEHPETTELFTLPPRPPVDRAPVMYREVDNRAMLYSTCACCQQAAVRLGQPLLCDRCGRAELEAEIARLVGAMEQALADWEAIQELTDAATMRRYARLCIDREALADADPTQRAKVERGIANARARGDALSELLAAEQTMGDRAEALAGRLEACRTALAMLAPLPPEATVQATFERAVNRRRRPRPAYAAMPTGDVAEDSEALALVKQFREKHG